MNAADVVLGNQGVNVLLVLSGFAYDTSTHIFSMNAKVENLLTQAIGTTDGSTTTAAGTRVYFTYGPVSSGVGTVSIIRPDGDTLFLGQADPYFQYTPLIKAGATSVSKTWQFQLSSNAVGFNFAVEVDAAVPSQNSVARWTVLRQGVTSNQLNAAWRHTATDVWAAGASGTFLHYDGTGWSVQSTGLPATSTYDGLWGTSGTDIWAVGNSGVAAHYNGSAWSSATTGSTATWNGVWGTAPNSYYAATSIGKGYFYNGTTWSAINFGFNVNANLRAVWGADASHIYMVGDRGVIVFYNGTKWSNVASPTTQSLTCIWGTSATNVYAAGAAGALIHFDGTAWSTQVSNTALPIAGLGGTAATDIWAVGSPGVTQHFDGTSWSTVAPVTGVNLTAVAAGNPGPLWAVGGSGALLTLSGTQVTLSDQSGLQLLGVWASSASNVWAAGPGTMLHYDGAQWTSAYVSANDAMASVWGTGPTNIYTVGHGGTIANYNGASWTSAIVNPPGGTASYNGVWGTSASNVYAVGSAGLIEKFNGTSWSLVTHTGAGNLTGVWGGGSPATFFAVASDGTAYSSTNGGTWTAVSFSPANGVALNGVYGSALGNVWATGNSGAAYIDLGPGFSNPSPANSLQTNFSGVWSTSPSDTYLVGVGGTVQHFNGTEWQQLPTPVITTLRSVYGTTAQNVYVVGDNGVVLLGTGP